MPFGPRSARRMLSGAKRKQVIGTTCNQPVRWADSCQCGWPELCQYGRVEPRADVLCRRIERCRRALREGVDAGTSLHYLYEIFAAEEELAELLRLDLQQTQHSVPQP